MNEILSTHFPQAENDSLWEVKQDIFDRIFSQVDNIHSDARLPAVLKNISLYLEADENAVYTDTKFGGISSSDTYNVSIKEYVKYDDSNWVVFIDVFNRPTFEDDGSVSDLNLENPYAQIKKIAVGSMDDAIFIAPGGAERVIALSNDFKMKKLGINLDSIKAYMKTKDLTDGYKVNEFDNGVYLLDSPAPLFANDSVEYRDGDYVGMWLSFGTLIKYDLRDLNVFNIDGVAVGGIDSDVTSKSVKILKMLTNVAYGHASIIFNKANLLNHLMKFSKRYIYETNLQNDTRICVDNILFNLTNTGILGLVYDEFEAVEEFPMFAYDEVQVSVVRKRGTVIKFKYVNDYIYMMLDLEANKMYFMSYHGRVKDYVSDRFGYSVTVMNDLWVSKTNDISPDNFILFTGFPNLQSNKVLDFYFDDTVESFSSLDKQFGLDVNEFDGFYAETVATPSAYSYDKNTSLMHVYGNNPIALVSGLLNYESIQPPTLLEEEKFELKTNASPDIKTFIDAEAKKVYMFEPVVNANGYLNKSLSPMRIYEFINNYVSRWKNGGDPSEWIDEANYGGYVYDLVVSYFSNGWTFFKSGPDTYKCVKLPTIRKSLSYAGSVVEDCLIESKAIIDTAVKVPKGTDVDKLQTAILDKTRLVSNNYSIEFKQIRMGFSTAIFKKMALDANIIDPDSAVFTFDRFEGSDDMFVNNAPTGPFANHAILMEDAFNSLILNTPDVYDDFMSFSHEAESFYCPYIKGFSYRKILDRITIDVQTDISTSRKVLRNKRVGIESYTSDRDRSGILDLGNGITIPQEEAYSNQLKITYFGKREILRDDYNIFRISSSSKLSKEVVALMNTAIQDKMETDFSEHEGAYEKWQEEVGGTVPIDIEMETGTPLYIALLDNKLKVSLDGRTFLDAPLGTDDFDISSEIRILDRQSFNRALNTMLYSSRNEIQVTLHAIEERLDTDIYSIGVENLVIDTDKIYTEGTVDVTAVLIVENGQAVPANTNFIYSSGETFSVSKTIEVDGFKRIAPEQGEYGTIKVLIPFSLNYHTLVPTRNEETFATADQLKLSDTAYDIKMNLPLFIAIPANEYQFVDKDEASQDGVNTWFNFTGAN